MPGSSLWLVPPRNHPIHEILVELINNAIPSLFPEQSTPRFPPHLTLTSEIPTKVYGEHPQEWLDSIPWPSGNRVTVEFQTIKTENIFYRRCYIKAGFDGVRDIAALARARGVNDEIDVGPKTLDWLEKWKSEFGPHVSLL